MSLILNRPSGLVLCMVKMLFLVIVLDRIGPKDSSITVKTKNSGECARARKL